jgi:hypothetical protein
VASSAYERMGNTPRAVETLRQAIVSDPTRNILYLHFADLCFAHSSFQVGIDMLMRDCRSCQTPLSCILLAVFCLCNSGSTQKQKAISTKPLDSILRKRSVRLLKD